MLIQKRGKGSQRRGVAFLGITVFRSTEQAQGVARLSTANSLKCLRLHFHKFRVGCLDFGKLLGRERRQAHRFLQRIRKLRVVTEVPLLPDWVARCRRQQCRCR